MTPVSARHDRVQSTPFGPVVIELNCSVFFFFCGYLNETIKEMLIGNKKWTL